MPIRVMLFDLWGTLLFDDSVAESTMHVRDALRISMARDALAAIGHEFDEERIAQAFDAASEEHGRIHGEALDLAAEGRTVLYLQHLAPALLDELNDEGWRRMHEAILTPALATPPAHSAARHRRSSSRIVFLDDRRGQRLAVEIDRTAAPFDAPGGDERAHMGIDDVFQCMNAG